MRRSLSFVRTNEKRAGSLAALPMATAQTTDTRERILHATLRTIAEQGVGAVSNRRVAAAAGVALGSLTYHFPQPDGRCCARA